LYNFNSMALHSLYCADVPLRNCSLTHPPSWHSCWYTGTRLVDGQPCTIARVTLNGRDNTTRCWRFLNELFLILIELSRMAETRWRRWRLHLTVRNDVVNAGSLGTHFRYHPMPRDQPYCWPMLTWRDPTELNWTKLRSELKFHSPSSHSLLFETIDNRIVLMCH